MTPEQQKKKSLELKKQGILEALGDGVVDLQFKKVNGDLRNMRGTRNLDLIPEDKHPKGEGTIRESDTTVTLFDLEVEDWRSFRVENLVEYRCSAWQ